MDGAIVVGGRITRGLIVGLTGGIATGKSTVSRMFEQLGAFVLSADEIARQVVLPGMPAAQDIRETFGDEVFLSDGTLDRAALGRIVFADSEARQRLESITHPHIRQELARRIEQGVEKGRIVVAEIPLLFESKAARALVDVTVVVAAETEVQLQRLMARDGLKEAEAQARIGAQLPLADKVARADYVIDNGGTLEQTRRQTEQVWSQLVRQNSLRMGT